MGASRDRVGWFTCEGEYIEFSLDGKELGRYDGPKRVSGFALSDDNEAVAGQFDKKITRFIVLNRASRTWDPVSLPKADSPGWARVLGFEGSTLLTTTNNGIVRRFKTR